MSKVLVNIHGAGKEMSDFYVEALNALCKVMGAEPACLPCWYADLSNIGAPVFGVDDSSLSPEAIEFRAELGKEIRERRKIIESQLPATTAEFGLMDSAMIVADLVSDVTRYLFDKDLQRQIQQRLREVLEKTKHQADETVLVSHSLGTVVAFDVLRADAHRYNVSTFMTMGSPLHKLVRFGRRSSDISAIIGKTVKQWRNLYDTTVKQWRNLYDTTDVVADAIGPAFPGYPIEDIFIQVADAPVPSHDYWRNPQVLNMIADTLR